MDACCLNRPYDDQRQIRVHLEAEAVLSILAAIRSGRWNGIDSTALRYEIAQMPDLIQRQRVEQSLQIMQQEILITPIETMRGQYLETIGFHPFDALHFCCAESASADIFLTTDDRLQKRATRRVKELRVPVENPLTWLQKQK